MGSKWHPIILNLPSYVKNKFLPIWIRKKRAGGSPSLKKNHFTDLALCIFRGKGNRPIALYSIAEIGRGEGIQYQA